MQKDLKFVIIVMILVNLVVAGVFVVAGMKFADNDNKIAALVEQQAVDSKFYHEFAEADIALDEINDKHDADVTKLLHTMAVSMDKMLPRLDDHANVINQHAKLLNNIKAYHVDVKEVLQYLVNRK